MKGSSTQGTLWYAVDLSFINLYATAILPSTHLEKRSAMALLLPRPLTRDNSFAVTRSDCDAHDIRLNGALSIFAAT